MTLLISNLCYAVLHFCIELQMIEILLCLVIKSEDLGPGVFAFISRLYEPRVILMDTDTISAVSAKRVLERLCPHINQAK